jgi:hypothetical protein
MIHSCRRLRETSPVLALFRQLPVPDLPLGDDTDPQSTDPVHASRIIAYTSDALATVSLHPEHGRWPVIQRGPRRIRDTLETAVALGDLLHQPDVSRFGVSALDDVYRQDLWLDDPDGPCSRPMPL